MVSDGKQLFLVARAVTCAVKMDGILTSCFGRWRETAHLTLVILTYLTYLSTLCFNLVEIISWVWDTLVF